MTDLAVASPHVPGNRADWMRAIAGELTDAGLAEIRWWNDLTAAPADVAARTFRVLTAASLPPASDPKSVQAPEHRP
jgi:hypothetical protein